MGKIMALLTACTMVLSFTSNTEIDIWHKVSTDTYNPGEIIDMDMSKGYSVCDGPNIYIIVRLVDSEEEAMLAFPNGGYWKSKAVDPFLQNLQEEFDSLEDYLQSQESKEIKKK